MAIDRQLEDACIQRGGGWATLYMRWLDRLGIKVGPPNAKGERACRSPFPFSDDGNPSFAFNEFNGLWIDWHAEARCGLKGGNYVQFVALMTAPVGADGRPRPNWTKAEHSIKVELGIAEPVDKAWLAACQALVDDEESIRAFQGVKPWRVETLRQLGVGWDPSRRRHVLPEYDRDGDLANTRLYKVVRPDPTIPKYMWSQQGLAANFLFPHCAWEESWVILVEGEGDVLTLRTLGYNACCGCFGSGAMVPEGLWWYGKQVFVLPDKDKAGADGAKEAIEVLVRGASSVTIATLPEWDGQGKGADVSDWVMYMLRQGMSDEEIKREITGILKAGSSISAVSAMYDAKPTSIPFKSAISAFNSDRKIQTATRVLSTGGEVFKLPTVVQMVCPGGGTPLCKGCPMHVRYKGIGRFTLDPRSPFSLKMIQCTDEQQENAIKRLHKIPEKCPLPEMVVLQSVDIVSVMMTSTMDEDAEDAAAGAKQHRQEAFALMRQGDRFEPNTDYNVTGFIYPSPRNQKLTMLIDNGERTFNRFETFNTKDNLELLSEFTPTMHPFDHVMDIADDLASSVTLIRGRRDLHAAYLVLWHSLTSFAAFGSVVQRGWIDCLIFGDTRCGKSVAFKKMAEWLGTGILIDCKFQTAPGMVGAVEASTLTGERYVVPGILPQCDMRGPVALDEFSSNAIQRNNMMDHLSSTRAEGQVRITKAASATFWARVRMAWLSNPGVRRLMHDIGGDGVEVIKRLINQPEDIARFDFAMAVTQRDVPLDMLNSKTPPTQPRRSQEAARALILWAWGRHAKQVEWCPGAEDMVMTYANLMCSRYDASIPLVEPADQRNKIAKVAVSIAVMCFSHTNGGESICVEVEHVEAAYRMFCMWYDSEAMGYDEYSSRTRFESSLGSPDLVDATLDLMFKGAEAAGADKLSRLEAFTDKMLLVLTPIGSMIELHAAMRVLCQCRAISPDEKGVYRLNMCFVRHLADYAKRRRDAIPTNGGTNGSQQESAGRPN